MRKKLYGTLLALLVAGGLEALEFKPVFDGQLGGGWGGLTGHDATESSTSWKWSGRVLALPMIGLGKNDYILPIFFADYSNRDRAIIEDDPWINRLLVVAKPTYKHKFSGDYEGSLYASYKRTVNVIVKDFPFGSGLYDNGEAGLGADFNKKNAWIFEELGLGLGWASKNYMNNHNPQAQQVVNNKNYYWKDYDSTKVTIDASLLSAAMGTMKIGYGLTLDDYRDSYITRIGGEVNTGERRFDQAHNLSVKATNSKGKLARSFEFGGTLNQSNYNYWDASVNTTFEDYYSYRAFSFKPGFTWHFQEKPESHRFGLSYEALLRDYVHQPVRNPDGTVTKSARADVEHYFVLNGVYVVTPWMNLFAQANYGAVRSNQAYERNLKASYDLFNAVAGVGLSY